MEKAFEDAIAFNISSVPMLNSSFSKTPAGPLANKVSAFLIYPAYSVIVSVPISYIGWFGISSTENSTLLFSYTNCNIFWYYYLFTVVLQEFFRFFNKFTIPLISSMKSLLYFPMFTPEPHRNMLATKPVVNI